MRSLTKNLSGRLSAGAKKSHAKRELCSSVSGLSFGGCAYLHSAGGRHSSLHLRQRGCIGVQTSCPFVGTLSSLTSFPMFF